MDQKNEMTFEEFKMNRREGFLEALSFGAVVILMIVLVIIMMISEVANSNVFLFRTISFVIGLMFWMYVSFRFHKVVRVQRAHPEWLAETSALKNKAELPKAWRIQRWSITIIAMVCVIIAFFSLYKPGSGITYDNSEEEKIRQEIITDETTDPYSGEDVQDAMDIISSLEAGNDEDADNSK